MITDPYQVLHISNTATDEEVKKAYRALARKYHPDNYHDNPLADLAQEKMKEINEAYEMIQKQRSGGMGSGYNSYGSGAYAYQQQTQSSGDARYQKIRGLLQNEELDRAEELLNNITTRDAEWYFLRGNLCYRRGWLDEARRLYESACQMNPNNVEYRQALAFMNQGGQAYRPGGFSGISDCDTGLCGRLCLGYALCNLGNLFCCL